MASRDRIIVAVIVLALGPRSEAQEVAKVATPFGEIPVIELKVSPTAAPVPTFRYRLLPMASELNPGDAAPIYLRLRSDLTDAEMQAFEEKSASWQVLPIDKIPAAEAHAFLDDWKVRIFDQLEYAARRRTCEWNDTLTEEKENAYSLLLPEVRDMRQWGRLLEAKSRLEISEAHFNEAIRTLETGFALGRHVADGRLLIRDLVGVSLCGVMLERVEEWAGRPDAPNLYWALTALPRPLIDVRRSLEFEQKLVEWALPELGELDRPRTEADWSALVGRFHARLTGLGEFISAELSTPDAPEWKPIELARFRADLLPQARAYVKARRGATDSLPDDQILMIFLAGRYREVRDDLYKPAYLAFSDTDAFYAATDKKLGEWKEGRRKGESKDRYLDLFAALAPSIRASHISQTRLDRKVALLRTIEAIRMQAVSDGGKLPDSLTKVTVVPVPDDPATGKPFELRRDGDAVILSPRTFDVYDMHLVYRITLRK